MRLRASIRWLCGLVVVACALGGASCGAKTGLRVPCEVPLEPVRPAVVLVIDRSDSMSNLTPDGRTSWEVLLASLQQTLPSFENTMALGAIIYPRGPRTATSLGCETFTDLGVAPAAGNADAIQRYAMSTGPPYGGTPTYDGLRVAADALSHLPAGTPRFLLLATDGGPNCNPGLTLATCDCYGAAPEHCFDHLGLSTTCSDAARVVNLLQGLATQGLETAVIGIENNVDFSVHDQVVQELNAMAVAGGRPLPAGGRRFYSVTGPGDLTRAFEDSLAALASCQLHGDLGGLDPEDLALISRELGQVPRDRTHRDGWDWVDVASGQLEVYGAWCTRLASSASAPRLVTPESRCW